MIGGKTIAIKGRKTVRTITVNNIIVPHLYELIKKKLEAYAVNGTLSYHDFNRIMSWAIHPSKHDSKIVLKEMDDMKIIKLGNRGLKIIVREELPYKQERDV